VALSIQKFIFYFSSVPLAGACLIGLFRYSRLDAVEISRTVRAIHALLYTFLNCFYIVALCVDPQPGPENKTSRTSITQS
jgi:hypothetical protein